MHRKKLPTHTHAIHTFPALSFLLDHKCSFALGCPPVERALQPPKKKEGEKRGRNFPLYTKANSKDFFRRGGGRGVERERDERFLSQNHRGSLLSRQTIATNYSRNKLPFMCS